MKAASYSALFAITFLVFGSIGCTLRRDSADKTIDNDGGTVLWLKASGLKIKTVYFASPPKSFNGIVVLFLHGDLDVPPVNYLFLSKLSQADTKAIYVELLRPGYVDAAGDRSGGERGLAVGDNYTPEVIGAIAAVCAQLKARFHPTSIILVGHSGGATLAADLIGLYPGIAAGVELIACGCDPVEWRARRAKQTGDAVWTAPVHSLMPLDTLRAVSPDTEFRLIVGEDDDVVGVEATRRYAEAARALNANVQLTIIPNRGHNDVTSGL